MQDHLPRLKTNMLNVYSAGVWGIKVCEGEGAVLWQRRSGDEFNVKWWATRREKRVSRSLQQPFVHL
jgi:hypothetical protein